MLDLECEGAGALVVKLFQVLLDAVNPMNASLVEEDATKVLWTMLEESEDVGPEILSAIMERLVQPCKTDNSAAHALACELRLVAASVRFLEFPGEPPAGQQHPALALLQVRR